MVSIVIVNYNTFQLTKNCIESILAHVKGVPFEIILVDNASTECDPADFIKLFPSLKLVLSEQNLGFAGGNNLGIHVAKGDQILLLNSDTVLNMDAVSHTAQMLNDNAGCGVVSCRLDFPDGKVQHNCQPFPNGLKRLAEITRVFKLFPPQLRSSYLQGVYFNYKRNGKPDWVWGTYFHFKKEVLASLPGKQLPEDYFMYVEDMQWCYVIRKAGWEICYDGDASVVHLMGQSNGKRNENMQTNLLDFIGRYYSPLQKALLKLSGFAG